MRDRISMLYCMMDKRSLRALSLIMSLLLGGCIFFFPTAFAAKTSHLAIWHSLVLMWAVCAGLIHGIGFYPRSVIWQAVFCPSLAALLLLIGLVFFFAFAIWQ